MQFFVSLVIVLIVSIILTLRYKNKEKVDKGFVFNYHKLSYRRKMIRTVTMLPFGIAAMILIYYNSDFSVGVTILIGFVFLILFAMQFFYNYVKWKEQEK